MHLSTHGSPDTVYIVYTGHLRINGKGFLPVISSGMGVNKCAFDPSADQLILHCRKLDLYFMVKICIVYMYTYIPGAPGECVDAFYRCSYEFS